MSIPNPARDPDGFFRTEETLHPDPIAMTARSMHGSGPLGSLLDRIDRALEAREERRFNRTRPVPPAGEEPAGRPTPAIGSAMTR